MADKEALEAVTSEAESLKIQLSEVRWGSWHWSTGRACLAFALLELD